MTAYEALTGKRYSDKIVVGYFPSHVVDWIVRGWLFPGARLIEFGGPENSRRPAPT